ncbi:Flp pilus assembly complex ATPase component TadA [Candidatus Woesebacteria bacterium]|nr:Flp pilus assembly complex ATPase component TadA [Candidatus Woesebacteria bacterium]
MTEPANAYRSSITPPGLVLPQVNAGQVPQNTNTLVGSAMGSVVLPAITPPNAAKPKSIDELSVIQIPSQEPTVISSNNTPTQQMPSSNSPQLATSSGIDSGTEDIPIQFIGDAPTEAEIDTAQASITPSILPSEVPVIPIVSGPATSVVQNATSPPELILVTPESVPDPIPEPVAIPSKPVAQEVQPAVESPATLPHKVDIQSKKPKSTTPLSLLDILVSQELLTTEQSNEILTQNIQTGLNIEHLIEKNKLVSEEDLVKARSEFYNIPYVDLNEVGVYPEALAQVPETVARNYWMLPFALNKDKNTLSVAMRNPLDVQAVDFVEHKTGHKVIAHFASASEIERLIAEQYSQSLSTEVTQALEQTKQVQQQKESQQDFGELSGGLIRQAPITKIVQTILSFSLKARASDIHIEPQENRTRVRYRIDGILQEKLILPKSVHQAVVSRIKILSGLKIDERRLPQDGRFDFSENNQQVDLRISTLPTIHGEKVVMRLLNKNANVPTLEEIGLSGLALRNVQDAIKVPHGIVLVTGPTGSGKTTTLYSVLHTINTPRVNIMTLEDPVEYQMPGINQVQINPQAGLTFASGLRSFLRQDPNIIMVGEIRDSETAGLAVQASLTGHLVFATLHTSSAAGALPRLMDMGAEPFLLASSMTCVLAQRIVRIINPEYKEAYKPEPAVIENIKTVLGDNFARWLQQNQKTEAEVVLMRPKKDRPEAEPDYKGRVAIFEVMKISEEIAKLIMSRKAASEMEKVSLKDGMLFMKQDGYLKVLDGVTTIEEVLRVAEI